MILRDKWIHVELVKQAESLVVLPDGVKPTISAETEVFQVAGVGLNVEDVRVGDEVVLMAALGSLMRFKWQDKTYYATLEGDVIAIMNRSLSEPNREVSDGTGNRSGNQEAGAKKDLTHWQ